MIQTKTGRAQTIGPSDGRSRSASSALHAHLRPRCIQPNAKSAPALVHWITSSLACRYPACWRHSSLAWHYRTGDRTRFQTGHTTLRANFVWLCTDLSDPPCSFLPSAIPPQQRFANGDFATAEEPWDASRNEAAVRDVVNTLGCLPLAIELAAARAGRWRMSVTALAAGAHRQPGVLATTAGSPLQKSELRCRQRAPHLRSDRWYGRLSG